MVATVQMVQIIFLRIHITKIHARMLLEIIQLLSPFQNPKNCRLSATFQHLELYFSILIFIELNDFTIKYWIIGGHVGGPLKIC